MKTMSPELREHWESPVRTIATCWRLDLKDGTTLGFTNHDRPIQYDGVTYQAASGFVPTEFEQSGSMAVDGMDVQAFLDSETITAADIAAGRYDKAEVRVFKLNWADLSMGILRIQRGWLGEISRMDALFVAEFRSLAQALQQRIGEEYLATCAADLGDQRCKVDLAAITVAGTVTEGGTLGFTDTGRSEVAGHFRYGLVTFTTGANAGRSMEVKAFDGQAFELFQPLPEPIEVGDAYDVYPGCDKHLDTCRDTFGNVPNFRGYPHIPGNDHMVQRP